MTLSETIAHLEALQDPTPEQLREASDMALLAVGWEKRPEIVNTPFGDDQRLWFEAPDGRRWRLDTGRAYPHPFASNDDAVKWMVPKGARYQCGWNESDGHWAEVSIDGRVWVYADHRPNTGAAITIAALKARKEET